MFLFLTLVSTTLLIKTASHREKIARRTGTYDVISAWKALLDAKDPREILSNRRLIEARQEINQEVERQTHTPPKFSKDGKIAVLKINSEAQVHPVIATRWVRPPYIPLRRKYLLNS